MLQEQGNKCHHNDCEQRASVNTEGQMKIQFKIKHIYQWKADENTHKKKTAKQNRDQFEKNSRRTSNNWKKETSMSSWNNIQINDAATICIISHSTFCFLCGFSACMWSQTAVHCRQSPTASRGLKLNWEKKADTLKCDVPLSNDALCSRAETMRTDVVDQAGRRLVESFSLQLDEWTEVSEEPQRNALLRHWYWQPLLARTFLQEVGGQRSKRNQRGHVLCCKWVPLYEEKYENGSNSNVNPETQWTRVLGLLQDTLNYNTKVRKPHQVNETQCAAENVQLHRSWRGCWSCDLPLRAEAVLSDRCIQQAEPTVSAEQGHRPLTLCNKVSDFLMRAELWNKGRVQIQ